VFFFGKPGDELLEDSFPGVGQGIDGMAHSVEETFFIKDFAVQDAGKIAADLVLIVPVGNIAADVLHHFHDLDVGTAVLRSFQGGHRSGDCRIGIRSRRGDDTRREGGIVSAAVFHMEDQGRIQDSRFGRGVFLVGTKHHQDIFRRRFLGIRTMDVHAVVIDVMVVGMIAVHGQHRESRNQHEGLADDGRDIRMGSIFIIGSQRQDAPRHGIHDILCRGLHDDVAREVGRQVPAARQHVDEFLGGLIVGKFAEQKQIGTFLKAEALPSVFLDQTADVVAAVPELALAGHMFFAVDILEGNDFRDVGQACQHAFSVDVAQSAVDAVFFKEVSGNRIIFDAERSLAVRVIQHFFFESHKRPPFLFIVRVQAKRGAGNDFY